MLQKSLDFVLGPEALRCQRTRRLREVQSEEVAGRKITELQRVKLVETLKTGLKENSNPSM